ncbi:copper resistance CopC family protein [Arthrobacter sp. C9C5]|uniref:copper resistance CopC family protein n=1 Tax=Arthrobacter sp. C9C5 TaxID=2735267 RepID=UPI00158499DD|nr:copper resistance CopC family protein [Arthrobacter sp. C9C5]NUU33353.1 copper resistance protein CopC [Arthrobacter sp. C9C5]
MKTTHRHSPGGPLARCLLVLATAAFLMVPAAAAQAHDVLESTDPANGSTVRTVPAKIGLTFDHTPIAIGSVVRVDDATGTDQADGPVVIVNNHVTQAVKTGAPDGKYTVIWRVVSSDGHPIEGTLTFTAGAANPSAAAAPSTSPASAGTGTGLQTGLVTAGAVAAVLLIALVVAGIFIKRRLRSPESGRETGTTSPHPVPPERAGQGEAASP